MKILLNELNISTEEVKGAESENKLVWLESKLEHYLCRLGQAKILDIKREV